MNTWFSRIVGIRWFASAANAQTLSDLGIPPTHIVISPTTLGSSAQPIADTNQDGITDYVVGIPWAADGQGAILIMPGPLPVAGRPAQDAIRMILGPYGPSLDLPTGFGAFIEVGCDLNMEGMPEVWTVASYKNHFSEVQRSILVFDLITNRVVWTSIDVPNLHVGWAGMMGCAPAYTHFITPHVPFSFDDPGFWFEPFCEICSGGPGSTSTTTQDSSSTTTTRLLGNSSSVNSGIGGKVG